MHALDEVQPAFGVSEEELQQVVQNGIIHYNKRVKVSVMRYSRDGVDLGRKSSKMAACWSSKSGTLIGHHWCLLYCMVRQPCAMSALTFLRAVWCR